MASCTLVLKRMLTLGTRAVGPGVTGRRSQLQCLVKSLDAAPAQFVSTCALACLQLVGHHSLAYFANGHVKQLEWWHGCLLKFGVLLEWMVTTPGSSVAMNEI